MDEVIVDKKQAFETLVIDHHVRLRAFVRSLGVDPDWVDDIAQESFLTAYREFDSYDESRDFGKWLRGIAANIVRNEIRKNARRQRILRNDLSEILLNRYDTIISPPNRSPSLPSAIACPNSPPPAAPSSWADTVTAKPPTSSPPVSSSPRPISARCSSESGVSSNTVSNAGH